MTFKKLSTRSLGLGLLFIFLIGASVYYFVISGLTEQGEEFILKNQATILRAEVKNLDSFFNSFGTSVAIRARRSDIEENGVGFVQSGLDVFVDEWSKSKLIGGIALTDSSGKVILNSNVMGTKDVGASVSDRDYFVWAKENHSSGGFFIGEPVVGRGKATQGSYVVPVAASITDTEGAFLGVVVSSVILEPLMARFAEQLKISDDSHIHLLNEQGVVLYDKLKPDSIGADIVERHPGLDRTFITSVLEKGTEEHFGATFESKEDNNDEHLFNILPFSLGDQRLYLMMYTPNIDSELITLPFSNKLSMVLVLLLISAVLFVTVGKRRINARKA